MLKEGFFDPTLLLFCSILGASTQWGLLTVFAQIDKKWISRQCNSSFLWPFMSALWSVPPKRSKQWCWQCCTKQIANCKLHKFTTPRGSGVGGGGWWGQKPCIEPIESGAERSRSGFLVLLWHRVSLVQVCPYATLEKSHMTSQEFRLNYSFVQHFTWPNSHKSLR